MSAADERPRSQPGPAADHSLEGAVQIAIMLVIGVAAGAASFSHVHDVAASHGQEGWLAWADAVVLELMSIASGLELRRRHRLGASPVFPVGVMVTAVLLSISAQLVEAQPSPIGWVAAALPALGFLVMVKIALGHIQDPVSAETGPAAEHVDGGSAATSEGPTAVREEAVPAGRLHDDSETEPAPRTPGQDVGADPATVALLPAARVAAEVWQANGRRLSRNALADVLRREGHAVSNARASALLQVLKAEGLSEPPVPTR